MITPNFTLLLALEKSATGANNHDIGEFTYKYKDACQKGFVKNVDLWEKSFNAFLSGRIKTLRKAVAEIRYEGKPPMYPNKTWWEE